MSAKPDKQLKTIAAVIKGHETVAEISEATGETKESVRHHLIQAVKEGVIFAHMGTNLSTDKNGKTMIRHVQKYTLEKQPDTIPKPDLNTAIGVLLARPAPTHEQHRPLAEWEM